VTKVKSEGWSLLDVIPGDLVEFNVKKYDIISPLCLLMRGYDANYYYRWGIMDYICVVSYITTTHMKIIHILTDFILKIIGC
jgi:hypothetical protein